MTLERPIWPNSNGQTLYFPMCAIFIFAPRAHGLINIVLTAAMHRALRALFESPNTLNRNLPSCSREYAGELHAMGAQKA